MLSNSEAEGKLLSFGELTDAFSSSERSERVEPPSGRHWEAERSNALTRQWKGGDFPKTGEDKAHRKRWPKSVILCYGSEGVPRRGSTSP